MGDDGFITMFWQPFAIDAKEHSELAKQFRKNLGSQDCNSKSTG